MKSWFVLRNGRYCLIKNCSGSSYFSSTKLLSSSMASIKPFSFFFCIRNHPLNSISFHKVIFAYFSFERTPIDSHFIVDSLATVKFRDSLLLLLSLIDFIHFIDILQTRSQQIFRFCTLSAENYFFFPPSFILK